MTAAAYRAAEPAPEILGISGVSTNNAWTSVGVLDWSAPVYYIMGTDINSAPNPYMYNAVLNVANGNEDAQPTLVYTSRQGGPAAAMYEYGADADSDAVWNMLPDIIVGTGQGESVDYSQANYAPAAGEANGTVNEKASEFFWGASSEGRKLRQLFYAPGLDPPEPLADSKVRQELLLGPGQPEG